MRCSVLRNFLLGEASAPELAADLTGTQVQASLDTVHHHMLDDLTEPFSVTPDHLVRLCDAVLAGHLLPSDLEVISFGMVAADEHFVWNTDTSQGEQVGETLYEWCAPEVNFSLNPDTVAKFRHRLLTGESLFTQADIEAKPSGRGRIVWNPGPRGR